MQKNGEKNSVRQYFKNKFRSFQNGGRPVDSALRQLRPPLLATLLTHLTYVPYYMCGVHMSRASPSKLCVRPVCYMPCRAAAGKSSAALPLHQAAHSAHYMCSCKATSQHDSASVGAKMGRDPCTTPDRALDTKKKARLVALTKPVRHHETLTLTA